MNWLFRILCSWGKHSNVITSEMDDTGCWATECRHCGTIGVDSYWDGIAG
jgi:hypothetical protein